MNNTDLYRAMGALDDDIVAETEAVWQRRPARRHSWKKFALLAACLAMMVHLLVGAANYGDAMERSAIQDALVDSTLVLHQIQPIDSPDGTAATMTEEEKEAYVDYVYDVVSQSWAYWYHLRLSLKETLRDALDNYYQTHTMDDPPVACGVIPRICSIKLGTLGEQESATVTWFSRYWSLSVVENTSGADETTYSVHASGSETYLTTVLVKEDGRWKLLSTEFDGWLSDTPHFDDPILYETYATQADATAAALSIDVPEPTLQLIHGTALCTIRYWVNGTTHQIKSWLNQQLFS